MKPTIWIALAGLILTAAVATAGYLVSIKDDAATKMDTHEKLAGHPLVVERVGGLKDDVDEIQQTVGMIRRDVSELLRRVPQ